jgi:hypothetical protein
MAYEIPGFYVGVFPADVDMSVESTWQFQGVGIYTALSTTGQGVGGAALCASSTSSSPILGILQNNPQQGEAGTVMVSGVSKALAGGTLNIGDLLMVNSAGAFVKATSSNFAVAQALELAASGDITTVLLIRNGKQ